MGDTKLTITIPSAQVTRVINGIAYQHGYQDDIDDGKGGTIANPQTKKDFIKEKLILWVKNNVKSYEANLSAKTARDAAITDVNENVTITIT